MDDLSQRQKDILRSIVNLYVLNASPVGSRTLSRHIHQEKLSPATIRNVMSDLEELDYITHPHTSAGRVPTDKGYRFYVDTLQQVSRLPKRDYEMLSKAVSSSKGQNESLKEASRALGMISRSLAVVRMPQLQDSIIEKIEIIPLSSSKILVVLQMQSDIISTVTLEADYSIDRRDLDQVNTFLNERTAGHTISYVKENFLQMISDYPSDMPLIRIFTDSVDKIFKGGNVNDGQQLLTAGFKDLLTNPEFEDISRVRGVIELLEDSDTIVHLIDAQEDHGDKTPNVIIGSETGSSDLRDYSIVMSRYRLSSGSGSIGLIGPKRMDYSRMLSIIKAITDLISV